MCRTPRPAVLAAILWLCLPTVAHADGMFMPLDKEYGRVYGDLGAASTEQKGIVIELPEGREALVLQTTYQGPAAEFAWIVPVPGEPAEADVVIASAEFIEHLLDTTAPRVETVIETPEGRTDVLVDEAPPAEMGGVRTGAAGGPEPTVTVHRRMDVGDYDVSVLSATGPEVLIDWLNANGYATPRQHAEVIDHYVRQRWYFVALRVRPAVAEARPRLDDVKPIAIVFPTEKLVYPLYISRASSRQKTALTLIALTREPVDCEGLTPVDPPLDQEIQRGTSYSAQRRAAVEGALRRPAAVVEYAGYGGVSEPDLHWDGRWPSEDRPATHLMRATRWWTILDLDEMQDLTLQPGAERSDRLVVERHGRIAGPSLLTRLRVSPAPVAAGVFLLLVLAGGWLRIPSVLLKAALLVGAFGVVSAQTVPGLRGFVAALGVLTMVGIVAALRSGRGVEPPGRPGLWAVLLWTGLTAGWVALVGLLSVRGMATLRHLDIGDLGSLPLTLAVVVWPVALLGIVAQRWPGWRGERWRFVVGTLLLTLPLWALSHHALIWRLRWGHPTIPLAGGVAMAMIVGGLFVLVWQIATRRLALMERRSAIGLAIFPVLGAALLLTVLPAWVEHGARMAIYQVLQMIAVAALLALAWVLLRGEGRDRAVAAAFALTLLVLGTATSLGRIAVTPPAHGGMMVSNSTGLRELDDALAKLDEALLRFISDTGCYPAALSDLIATTAPAQGLDSSGNPVPLAGAFAGPYLQELPEDPLTRKRDTWLYEVTGAPMVDTGGLTIKIRREPTLTLEDVRQRLSSSTDRAPIYPFAMNSGKFRQFGGHPGGRLARLVVGRSYAHGALLVADPARGIAAREALAPAPSGLPALCLSPDGERVAVAQNRPRTVRIATCEVFYQTGQYPVRMGGETRLLTPGPWHADVSAIAWHPTEERWAVVTREYTEAARPESHLWLLDGVSEPVEIGVVAGEARGLSWAPDGQSLYVFLEKEVTREERSEHAAFAAVSVREIGLDGVQRDAFDGYRGVFATNRHGRASADGTREEVEYVAPNGTATRLLKPEGARFADDLWVGPDTVIAAWAPDVRGGPHSGSQEVPGRSGLVCVYAPPTAEPQIIGRYIAGAGAHPLIIGRDAASGMSAMAYGLDPINDRKYGRHAGIYALLPQAPYARRLAEVDPGWLSSRDLHWAGQPVRAQLVDWVPASALQLGDLVLRDPDSNSADGVAGIYAGAVVVGDQRIAIPEGLPVIGETEFLQRYRLVE